MGHAEPAHGLVQRSDSAGDRKPGSRAQTAARILVVVQPVRDVDKERSYSFAVRVPGRKVITCNLERCTGFGHDFDHRYATHPRSELGALKVKHRGSNGVGAFRYIIERAQGVLRVLESKRRVTTFERDPGEVNEDLRSELATRCDSCRDVEPRAVVLASESRAWLGSIRVSQMQVRESDIRVASGLFTQDERSFKTAAALVSRPSAN